MPEYISNTSCLVILDNIKKLELLKKLYKKVFITKEVQKEFVEKLPGWIIVRQVSDKKCIKILKSFIDIGEASTIALFLEMQNSVIILDDLKTRIIAVSLNINITGTLGIILKAKEKGYISSVKKNYIINETKRV